MYLGGEVGKVDGVIFYGRGDLVEGFIFSAVDMETEFFLDSGECGGLKAELDKQ